MKSVAIIALLVLLGVYECQSQCISQLSQYVKGFEESRAQVCKSDGGLVLSGQSLEPVMETIAKILDNQPPQLKGAIPDVVHKLFPQIRVVLTRSNIDLCNNKEVQSILRAVEQTIDRDLQSLDRVMEPYCEDYMKFLESKVGQNLVGDVNNLLRDVGGVDVRDVIIE